MGKKAKRRISVLLFAMLIVIGSLTAYAAGTPGNVKNLKQKSVSETSVKLTWSKVSGATGYMVYLYDASTGKQTRTSKTKSTSVTLKKLVPNTAYQYYVYAYKTSGSDTVLSAQPAKITVKTSVKKPSNPSGFTISSKTKSSLTLKWNTAKNATGYVIYRYDSTKKEYVEYTTTTKKTITVSGLSEGVTEKFAIRAYRKVSGQTAYSSKLAYVSGAAKGLSALASSVHGRYFNATLRYTVTGTATDGTKVTIKKGTKVTSTGRTSGQIYVILSSGTKVKISGKALRYNSINYTKTYYSKETAEAFVNEKGFSSSTRYLIWISQYTSSVMIFKGSTGNWTLVRKCPAVIGKDGKTSVGTTFRLCRRDYAYGGPRVYFTWNESKQWGNSFHLRVDGHTRGAYSHGCVRLGSSDLYYLVNNCPMGTRVVSY